MRSSSRRHRAALFTADAGDLDSMHCAEMTTAAAQHMPKNYSTARDWRQTLDAPPRQRPPERCGSLARSRSSKRAEPALEEAHAARSTAADDPHAVERERERNVPLIERRNKNKARLVPVEPNATLPSMYNAVEPEEGVAPRDRRIITRSDGRRRQ